MADVADGRVRADAGPGASFHRAGERAGPCLWLKALHGGDTAALWRAGPPPRDPRLRRWAPVGRRLRDPRLGLAAPAPQGGAFGLPPCQTLVRRADGAAGSEARHGSEAGLTGFGHHPRRRMIQYAVSPV